MAAIDKEKPCCKGDEQELCDEGGKYLQVGTCIGGVIVWDTVPISEIIPPPMAATKPVE